jgi:hypothetical protein
LTKDKKKFSSLSYKEMPVVVKTNRIVKQAMIKEECIVGSEDVISAIEN